MERVVIKNFLTIKEAELEIKPFTVLIGDNAEGKSIIAKIYYILKKLEFMILLISVLKNRNKTVKEQYKDVLNRMINNLKGTFLNVFPADKIYPLEANIKYLIRDFTLVDMRIVKDSVDININADLPSELLEKIHFDEGFVKAIEHLFEYSLKPESLPPKDIGGQTVVINDVDFLLSLMILFVLAGLKSELKGKELPSVLYLPHGRSMFLYIRKMLDFSKISEIADKLLIDFVNEYNLAEEWLMKGSDKFYKNNPVYKEFVEFEKKILKGYMDIAVKPVKRVVLKSRDESLAWDPDYLSSGQQELFPVFLFLRKAVAMKKKNLLFVIEEPEAHLFPKRQIDLVYLFSFIRNKIGTRFFLTTHSPYIISAVNNLLLAWKEFQASQSAALKKEYEDIWMSPNDVSVYEVKDGEVRDLIGKDGLVDANVIDLVMEFVSDEIDKILSLAQKQ